MCTQQTVMPGIAAFILRLTWWMLYKQALAAFGTGNAQYVKQGW